MNTLNFSILFITQAGRKSGIGHLEKILDLSKHCTNPFILIISDSKIDISLEDLSKVPHKFLQKKTTLEKSKLLKEHSFDLIICDCPSLEDNWAQDICNSKLPVISFKNRILGEGSEVFIESMVSTKIANFSEWYHSTSTDNVEIYDPPKTCEKILLIADKMDKNKGITKLIKSLKQLSYKISLKPSLFSTLKPEDLDGVHLLPPSHDISFSIKDHDLIISQDITKLPIALLSNRYLIALMENSEIQSSPLVQTFCSVLKTSFLSKRRIRSTLAKMLIKPHSIPNNFNFMSFLNELCTSIVQRPAQCPLCKSHNKKRIIANEIYNLFSCLNCKSRYYYNINRSQHSIINPDKFIPLNSEQRQQGYKEIVLKQKEESYKRIYWIKNIMPTPSGYESYNLLDIGAEYGIFVQEASHNGFFAQGVELSLFSRRLADTNNVQMIDSMEKVYERGSIYDVITIWKKLEFLDNPMNYLKSISYLIRVGGLLIFRIPQASFSNFNVGRFQATAKGSELFSRELGFDLKKIKTYTDNTKTKFFELYCMKK